MVKLWVGFYVLIIMGVIFNTNETLISILRYKIEVRTSDTEVRMLDTNSFSRVLI